MATVAQCRAALERLADRMAAQPDRVRGRVDLNRTLRCRITDLETTFSARLIDGQLRDLAQVETPDPQITLITTSDDLIAVLDGHLDITRAVATGRMTVRANPFDLLKLRKLR